MINKNKGFSLIEILLVIGFVAAAIAAVFVVYPKVQTSNQANSEAQNLSTISAGIKALFSSQSNYAGINQSILACAKVMPDNMIVGTPTCGASPSAVVKSVWGGDVIVAPANFNGGTSNAVAITYNDVPTEACIKLSTQAGATFNVVTIGSTTVKDSSVPTLFSSINATAACSGATSVNIVFTTN